MRKLLLFLSLVVICAQMVVAQNNTPVAVEDSLDGIAQVPILINVLANDYDPDGDSIFIVDVNSYSGEAYIENNKIWYIPKYFPGLQHFRYTISDGNLDDTERVYINVSLNPNAPVAMPDTLDVMELIPQTINVLSNDHDPNNDLFKIHEISEVYGCEAILNNDSLLITVIPDLYYSASFVYQLVEKEGDSLLSQKVKVLLLNNENPDKPVAVKDTVYATGGISINIPVLNNDFDPQGESIEIYHFGGGQHGSVIIEGSTVKYTPELSYSGTDRFYYSIREVNDTSIYSLSAWVDIIISKNPDCPIGLPDLASGMSATPILIDVLQNDYDPNGDPISILCGDPRVTITSDNKISYKSYSYTTDYDSIYYTVVETNNPSSFSNAVKVFITLEPNPAYPWGVNDTVTTYAGSKIDIYPLINDIGNGYDSLEIHLVIPDQDKRYQALVEKINDKIIYTPAYQTSGTHRLRYIFRPANTGYTTLGGGWIIVNVQPINFTDSLIVNNINAAVSANGDLFSFSYLIPNHQEESYYKPQFEVPAGGGVSTIFQNRFLIGGVDNNDKIHLTANKAEWKQGPVSEMYDSSLYKLRYYRVWKITNTEIEYHKQNYQTPNYQPSENIVTWPGNGFHTKGEALHLAPFYDVNGDDNYQPDQGDYPLIRGDECIFFICNDDMERLNDTTASPLKVELHGMVYAFHDPTDTALFNTVFVHYDIINRSATTYTDCFAGVYTDYDIGYYSDDFYRTDVNRGSVIGYNSKDIDAGDYVFNYGDNPPAQSVTVLAGPFIDPDQNDNPAGGCDISINGLNFENNIIDDERHGLSRAIEFNTYDEDFWGIDPVTNSEQYYYMQGYWDDESPILYGGNAHQSNGATGPEARYMFPGDSDPLNYGTNCEFPANGYNQGNKFWTEEQVRNLGGDRSALASMGPFTFAPGQVQEIELAYCTGLGNNGAMSSVHQLLRNIDSLRAAVAQGKIIVPNGSLGMRPDILPANVQLYPNPATDVIAISNMGANNGAEFTICNFYGSVVAKGVLTGSKPIIRVNHLAPGLYIIKISNGDTVSTGKFIKM